MRATEITLGSSIDSIPGLRPFARAGLVALGVKNLGQLAAYLPMRHERLEAEAPIDKVAADAIVTARGEIAATRSVRTGKRPRFEAVLCDDTGRLDLVWFNQLYLRERIHPGMRLRVQGKAKRRGPGIQLANPKFDIIHEEEHEPPAREARVRPVYPASEQCPSRLIEQAIAGALPLALPLIEDHLTDEFRRQKELPALRDAYRMIHGPRTEDEAAAARRRLAYDELLLLQLGVHLKRAHLRQTLRAPKLRWTEAIDAHIRKRFPFTLTASQESVIRDIIADLSTGTPTNRLIQGDVGSGKTIVALYAMLMAVASRHQAALMAPTEILAEQHLASISALLEGSAVKIELLTGALPSAERKAILARVESGEVDIVIGTHALLTETVKFHSLAVAIVDEQHRFGVHQRAELRTKGGHEETLTPHVLVMTATPIPRTLALTLFGDLDVSTIRELPPGRTPIKTRLVPPERAGEVYAFVRQRIDAGDQAYIVVPAIDTGEGEGLSDVRTLQSRLEQNELKDVRVAAMHGRLARKTRESIMARFRAGTIKALVATTVIEVGVDVPNATVMVVEHADRFGLAQLHQLRGRVGRARKKSVCILIGEPVTPEAQARLAVMAETSDGFTLAEKDMEIRGPGEVFGTRQAGMPPFKVADLMRDRELLNMARRDAAAWIERSPRLDRPDEAVLLRRLIKAHGQWLGLGDVG